MRMLRRVLLGAIVSLGWLAAEAGPIGRALKMLAENKLPEARKLIEKQARKEPQHPAWSYLRGRWFIHPAQVAQIDSALEQVRAARAQLAVATADHLEDLGKAQLAPADFQKLEEKVDSLGFDRATRTATVGAYNQFIKQFATAQQVSLATRLRDRLAFEQVKAQHTWQAYEQFVREYPQAEQTSQAQTLAQQLQFVEATRSGKAEDYRQFLRQFPDNPFAPQARHKLFERVCAPHKAETYRRFAEDFPDTREGRLALSYLYFLDTSAQGLSFLQRDDIKRQMPLTWLDRWSDTLVPYQNKQGRWGYLSLDGKAGIEAHFTYIPQHEKQAFVPARHLVGLDEVILAMARHRHAKGYSLADSVLEEEDPIRWKAPGYYEVREGGLSGLVMQGAGWILPPVYEEIRLESRVIVAKQNGQSGLFSYQGEALLPCAYDDIETLDEQLILIKGGRYGAVSLPGLLARLEGDSVEIRLGYDELRFTKEGLLQARIGGNWGLLSPQGRTLVPLSASRLLAFPLGWAAEMGPQQYSLYTRQGQALSADARYESVLGNENLWAVKQEGRWGLLNAQGQWIRSQAEYDSVLVLDKTLTAIRLNNRWFLNNGSEQWTDFSGYTQVSRLQHPASRTRYLLVGNAEGKQGVLSAKGRVILPCQYERISLPSPYILLAGNGEKFQLFDTLGRAMSPQKVDGAGQLTGQALNVVLNRRFGIFSPEEKKIIVPAVYESSLTVYQPSKDWYVSSVQGKQGIVGPGGKVVVPFGYDQVVYWAEKMAWVRCGEDWYFYDLLLRVPSESSYQGSEMLSLPGGEKLLLTRLGGKAGLISNRLGLLIPTEYDDITSGGTPANPIFIARKKASEGAAAQVMIYNRQGKVLWQE